MRLLYLYLDPTFVKERCVVRPVRFLFYLSSVWTLGHPQLTFNPTTVLNVFDSCARCSAQWHPQTRPGSSCRAFSCFPFLVDIHIYVVLSVPGQARGYHGQFTQAYRACARPVRTSDLYLVLFIEALGG